jgi:hypothetical protein
MATRIRTQRPLEGHTLDLKAWSLLGALAAAAGIAGVLAAQAAALSLWPEAAQFKPLDSYARSVLFTLVPALAATVILAQLARRTSQPIPTFLRIGAVVLLASFIPDYLLPDPNKTLLASTVAAGLHMVAGALITAVLVAGYQHKTGQCAALNGRTPAA